MTITVGSTHAMHCTTPFVRFGATFKTSGGYIGTSGAIL